MCTPLGLECYQSVNVYAKECLTMCKGLYADVNKKADFQQMDKIENVRETVERYEDYKRGFQEDIIKYYEYVFTSMF